MLLLLQRARGRTRALAHPLALVRCPEPQGLVYNRERVCEPDIHLVRACAALCEKMGGLVTPTLLSGNTGMKLKIVVIVLIFALMIFAMEKPWLLR